MKKILLFVVTMVWFARVNAQLPTNNPVKLKAEEPPKAITYLMPDGRVLDPDKMDSVASAWGKGRVMFQHTQADDENGVIHLMRMTDEMEKKFADDAAKAEAVMIAMTGKPAPEFNLTDLEGRAISLQSLKGKVIVMNFWFTSCPPCVHEMPELNRLVSKYDAQKVVFLGMTFNKKPQILTFLKAHQFLFTILPETAEVDKKYQISSWPTTVIIDRQGIIKLITNSSPDIFKKIDPVISANL